MEEWARLILSPTEYDSDRTSLGERHHNTTPNRPLHILQPRFGRNCSRRCFTRKHARDSPPCLPLSPEFSVVAHRDNASSLDGPSSISLEPRSIQAKEDQSEAITGYLPILSFRDLCSLEDHAKSMLPDYCSFPCLFDSPTTHSHQPPTAFLQPRSPDRNVLPPSFTSVFFNPLTPPAAVYFTPQEQYI